MRYGQTRIDWSSPEVIGRQFNKLCVTRVLPTKSGTNRWVECICDCGNVTRVLNCSLTSGQTRSCGCLHACGKTHGETNSPTYRAWENACKQGRKRKGPRTCPEWVSYEKFVCDMGHKPTPSHFLCRLDKRQGFNPSNCKWSLSKRNQPNPS